MRVLLERHQLFDLLGPEGDDAPDVVAGEVDEHHVLGAFLRMLDELRREAPVVLPACGRGGACPRSGG